MTRFRRSIVTPARSIDRAHAAVDVRVDAEPHRVATKRCRDPLCVT